MIPSTLTPRTNYCFHWTLVVDTGLAALKVGCFFKLVEQWIKEKLFGVVLESFKEV